MEQTTTIQVSKYYGNPSYYSVMPQPIFDALEEASLMGETTATVNAAMFDQMEKDYQTKMVK